MTIYDQLNVVDLASGELLAHIVQLHEERCRERLAPETKGDNLDTHLILGCDLVRGNICVSPQLAEHLKEELTKEWAVAKERRKARARSARWLPRGR
eukprot:8254733-Pyramimonas_sp.AAC.1